MLFPRRSSLDASRNGLAASESASFCWRQASEQATYQNFRPASAIYSNSMTSPEQKTLSHRTISSLPLWGAYANKRLGTSRRKSCPDAPKRFQDVPRTRRTSNLLTEYSFSE